MDRDFLQELFAGFGPVALRRMFSGYGVSADGVNFALVLRGAIYLRADAATIPLFEAEGCKPFQYPARGKIVTVKSYWQIPDRLYDDPDDLAEWSRRALAAARLAAGEKAARPRTSKSAARGGSRTKAAKKAGPRQAT